MRLSEQRARSVTKELLSFRGWDLRPVSSGGQLLEESEYRQYASLINIFTSKTGPGIGKPDFLLVDTPANLRPLIVIDTKPRMADLQKSIIDTRHYADSIHQHGQDSLAVAVAGAEKELCEVRVQRRDAGGWHDLTLHQRAIDWIPSPAQTRHLLSIQGLTEVAPEAPPEHVLAAQANRLNEILRECNIKDEYRPVYAAAFMLSMWFAEVSIDPKVVLNQVNTNTALAMQVAEKPSLSSSLRVDTANTDLADRAWEIIDILKKLNIRSFMNEHDYLGQLYETFFRYTGGNTIGQYFTPRHIVRFMCDLVKVGPNDVVFDPACGTGGFLIGALNRMVQVKNLSYDDAVKQARHHLFGMEVEPTTAALCVTNMILRGDGKSGVIRGNCFSDTNYPPKPVTIALLNPPFPHKHNAAQKPATAFIDRALASVAHKGIVAAVVPYSLLANVKEWHKGILKNNTLQLVATLPADLFNPYSNYDTAIIIIQKGVPHHNGRTFFARINNDGFRMKKAARIPRPGGGSQLPALLDAYDRKIEAPEFSAYRQVTMDTEEWAPETFIDSAPHGDAEFTKGFEEAVREQAAFYIRYGHRLLEADSVSNLTDTQEIFFTNPKLSLSDLAMGPFKISDYFTVSMGGKDEIEDLDEGDDPFISTSERDNGVSNWKTANRLFPAGTITVATDGSAYTSFVQEFPFYAFYKVALLRPKVADSIPIDALYYVSYLINREFWRFVRARKYGKGRIETTVLFAPSKGGKPDFERMAELSRQTAAFPIIKSFRQARRRSIEVAFEKAVSAWKKSQAFNSSLARMVSHPAYRGIVRLGTPAVPLLLRELAGC